MGRHTITFLLAATLMALAVTAVVGLSLRPRRTSFDKATAKRDPSVTYLTTTQWKTQADTQQPRTRIPEFLHAKVKDLPNQMWSVANAAAILRKRGHRVCCEELHRRIDEQPIIFRLSTQPRALHEVLDDLTVGDANYRWDWMANSDIINIVPVHSRLNVQFETFDCHDRRLIMCVGELHAPCKLGYGDFLLGNMKDPGRIENWPFSLRASSVVARDYLNLLARQYDGMTWHVRVGTSVYFEVNPPEEFDRVAEKLRSEARLREQQIRAAAKAETPAQE